MSFQSRLRNKLQNYLKCYCKLKSIQDCFLILSIEMDKSSVVTMHAFKRIKQEFSLNSNPNRKELLNYRNCIISFNADQSHITIVYFGLSPLPIDILYDVSLFGKRNTF